MSNHETSEPPYSYRFKGKVLKSLQKLDKPIRERFLSKLIERCQNPYVASAALHGELAGYYKIKVRGVRLIYTVIEKELVLLVVLIDKRENDDVYS
ncbi:type II toxin-antitoxin system RelE family toxin [Acetobacter persici]|uniref:type II toxin-antitoxin system RelE family toxin n=1 Tax=Acetobacter persici TaxID=1076596 RepID=UPI001BAC4786|nr:type II toxin-antitoxin system RelE/ParE family toxin [Acetobacter persici]MBS1016883.1 type II toxin-antitoxin system RelE/ParE family toxin [Acetobacter persici]